MGNHDRPCRQRLADPDAVARQQLSITSAHDPLPSEVLTMSTRTSRVALALAVVCAGVSLAHAANPTFWQVSNEAEFSKGDVENLSIDASGRITPAPSAPPLYDASAPFLWSMINAPDGSMYVGSGNEGQIY